jgi:hypothetical protein
VFSVAVAQRDRNLLEGLQTFLGAGCIYDRPRRKAHWQPVSTFCIASRKANLQRVVPFADRFLLPGAKRRQYEPWRDSLRAYVTAHPPRRRSVCSKEGCDGLVRGRGLCRSHYYRATGY